MDGTYSGISLAHAHLNNVTVSSPVLRGSTLYEAGGAGGDRITARAPLREIDTLEVVPYEEDGMTVTDAMRAFRGSKRR